MYKVNSPEDVVFYTDSEEKSIILITGDGKLLYANEGLYGGYVIKEDIGEELINNALSFLVEPNVKKIKYDELDEPTRKHVNETLGKLPSEVREVFLNIDEKPRNIEIIDYKYYEINAKIKKQTNKYTILDFEPKPDGLRLSAKAIRLYVEYNGSNRYPLGKEASKKYKEFKLKYPDNEIIQKYMYPKKISFKHSKLYIKIPIEAPKELLPYTLQTRIEDTENIDLENIDIDLDEIAKEFGINGFKPASTTAVQKKEEKLDKPKSNTEKEEELSLSKEELEKLVENTIMKRGLRQVKLIVFKLPTEYLKSKTRMIEEKENGKYYEIKELTLKPAQFRTLRKKFYNALHNVAWKSEIGWITYHDADLSEINKYIDELNSLLKKYNINDERFIEIIEAYLPQEFLVKELTRYIRERKTSYEYITEKIREQQQKAETLRRLRNEALKLEQQLKKLEQELKYLKI